MDGSELLVRENYSIEAEGADGDEKPTRARVIFHVPLSSPDWAELHRSLSEFIDRGFSEWVLDLRKLDLIYSHDLGMLVSTNGTIEHRSGRMSVRVRADSAVEKVLALTRLQAILHVEAD